MNDIIKKTGGTGVWIGVGIALGAVVAILIVYCGYK
jgi:hypothetical protein